MKSGFERIGFTVTVETAQKGCFGKVRYYSRNAARDKATKYRKKFPETPPQRPYRCILCGDFHLTTQVPEGLRRGKDHREGGKRKPAGKEYPRLPEEG
jgi:hypothetical protein